MMVLSDGDGDGQGKKIWRKENGGLGLKGRLLEMTQLVKKMVVYDWLTEVASQATLL
jgi:hypothetical protein